MRNVPVVTLLTCALAALLVPAYAGAQSLPPELRVEGRGEPVTAGVAMHRGYPAYPAWTLRALDAEVGDAAGGGRLILAGDTVKFEVASVFLRRGNAAYQLVEPPYREGGVLYLPHQFFTEWLPGAYPDRLSYQGGVLRLRGGGTVASEGAGESSASTSEAPAPQAPSSGAPLGEPSRAPLVVIDPGHGGVDPGRVGPSGIKEKDIVLQVSRRLARVLAERGYEVRLTRTADTLINLDHRAPMANQWRGARPGLFLSIHANGVTDRRARGFETFFLSEARTDDERRVAEMENAAVEYEESTRVVGSTDLDLIRNGLRNEFYIMASNSLAGLVQDEFTGFHSGPNRGVKQAGFRVLVGAFMPAVLIELAFLSNPAEERLLGSGSFQVEAAQGIANAVDRFFESHQDWTGATP